MKRLLRLEWEVIAGLLAAVTALVLHFLHIIETEILLNVAVILIASVSEGLTAGTANRPH